MKDIDAVFDAVGDKDSYIRSQLPGVLKEGGKYGTVANGAAVNYNPNLVGRIFVCWHDCFASFLTLNSSFFFLVHRNGSD